jgi:hypothetical protein
LQVAPPAQLLTQLAPRQATLQSEFWLHAATHDEPEHSCQQLAPAPHVGRQLPMLEQPV